MNRIGISIFAMIACTACAGAELFDDTGPADPPDGGLARGATTTDSVPADGDYDDVGGGADAGAIFTGENARNCLSDAEDTPDCSEPSCAEVASCTVGNGNLCTELSNESLAIDGCAESPVTTACIGDVAEPFGSPSPWVASGALHPGGDDGDSGILYQDAVALRSHRLALRATIQEPACIPGESCIDLVALGVTLQSKAELDAGAPVRSHVALAYSGARREVFLRLSGAVVARWEIAGLSSDWTLILRPDGLVDVHNAGVSVLGELVPYAPVDGARVVVYGRNMNRAYPSPDGAALTSLEVRTSACDIPSAWEERSPIGFSVASGGAPVTTINPAQVSAVVGGADPRLYLVHREDGDAPGQERFLAAFETSDPNDYRLAHTYAEPILTPSTAFDGGGIADPDVFWDGEAFHLYYTATDPVTGVRTIAHASGPEIDALTKDPAPLIVPGDHGLEHLEMPSFARSGGDVDVLLARGIEQSAHRLVAFVLVDGTWARLTGSELDVDTRREEGVRLARFDGDEIAHPSIVRVGGSFHIYYAGRRGTRWSVGLLATDELLYVRDVTEDGPLLRGSSEGFDALSVLEPDILVEPDRVSLYYVGTDGATRTVGRVTRRTGSTE